MGVGSKPGGRTATWPRAAAKGHGYAPGWAVIIGSFAQNWAGRFAHWVSRDTAPGRLFPWFPVAFGAGIAVYFAAAREPTWWSGLLLLAPALAASVRLRAHPIGFPMALALTAMTAG